MKSKFRTFVTVFLLVSGLPVYGQDLLINTNFEDGQWLSRDDKITLYLNRTLDSSKERLAIFIDGADMSTLFKTASDSFTYTPTMILLPSGETTLSVNLVSPDNSWQEIAQFPLKVRTNVGLDKAQVDPSITINNNGQVAEGHSPDSSAPPRETYQDFSGQINFTSEHIRDQFALRSQWDLVGTSEQNQTLRFGEKGEDAAKIDLSSYQVQMQLGQTELSVGHISHGRQKHLINFYNSRGIKAKAQIGSKADFSASAMNGTQIVGWDNFIGLSKSDHRIYSGTLGIELLDRPGGLRLESSFMDASLLPESNFNQGVINDAEESRGFGFHAQASDNSQRIRLEGGFARSSFTNPFDPFLNQDAQVVPVEETTRNARYGSLALGVLQNVTLSPTWQLNLNVNIRHERVDPLYRSLGAFVRSDYLENAVDLQSNIGNIYMQYSHSRSEDNLDEIPSILKTKTRLNSVNLNIPLGLIFVQETGPPSWLPSVTYGYNRTHQFGDELPVNGGFSDGHVPDQVSDSHTGGLDWQGQKLRFSYQLAFSEQDNRQPGRENSDFSNLNNSFNLGLSPLNVLDLNFDVSFENAENKELDRTDLTRRIGGSLNLRTTRTSVLSINLAKTNSENNDKTFEQNNIFINAQWSLSFTLKRTASRQFFQGQVFVRYTRNESESNDTVFGFSDDLENWSINTGVNLSIF